MLDRLRRFSSLERVRKCRRVTMTGTGGPVLRVLQTVTQVLAGFAGLTTCGSVWACPCCAAKVAAPRAAELASVMRAVDQAGGASYMLTLTMRHSRGMALAMLWAALADSWTKLLTGTPWTRQRDRYRMIGWAKTVEATWGRSNGWHLHVHVLLCFAADPGEVEARRLAHWMWQRWDRTLRTHGLSSTERRGVDIRRARFGRDSLADYFTKLAREITHGHAKTAGGGRRYTPFSIASELVETYDADLGDLWREWEQTSRGRRQLTWSTAKGMDLRGFAGLGREATDDELAAAELQGEDAFTLDADTWAEVRRHDAGTALLDAAEQGGTAGALAWLTARDLTADPAAERPRDPGPRPHPTRWRAQARMVLAGRPDTS